MNGTLVFHSGALGDSVITWPLLRALAPLALVTQRGKAQLAARYIDGVEPVDGDAPAWSQLFASDLDAVDPAVRDRLAAADRIVTFFSTGDDAWWRNVRRLAPGAAVVPLGFRPPADLPMPPAAWHRRQLAMDYPLDTPRRLNANGAWVIHPGAGSPAKCWPLDRFIDVARRIAARGRAVRFILGEAELERWLPEAVDSLRSCAEVVTPADYLALADVVEPAWSFLGNDSGPSHLAAALGIPTLTLLGPTDPRVWCPIGATALDHMHDRDADDVLAEIRRTTGEIVT